MIQRAGYHEHRDPRTGERSFSRRLGTYHYPRFHLYIEERASDVIYNLHLDQKQASYAGSHMHAGEYDGEMVEREAVRLQSSFTEQASSQQQDAVKPLSLFARLRRALRGGDPE